MMRFQLPFTWAKTIPQGVWAVSNPCRLYCLSRTKPWMLPGPRHVGISPSYGGYLHATLTGYKEMSKGVVVLTKTLYTPKGSAPLLFIPSVWCQSGQKLKHYGPDSICGVRITTLRIHLIWRACGGAVITFVKQTECLDLNSWVDLTELPLYLHSAHIINPIITELRRWSSLQIR